MKKILSLGTAAAVLSLTAVAASAALAPVVSDSAEGGDQVVVEVVATDYAADVVSVGIKAEGLTLADYVTTDSGVAVFNADEMHFGWVSTAAPADGAVLLTLVFDVDAEVGEEVSVALVPDEGFEEGVDAAAVTMVVVDGAESDQGDVSTDTEPSTDTESEYTSSEEPVLSTDEPTTTEPAGADDNNGEQPPKTGIALAVVPAIVAGAAVVVAKKRK